MKHSIRYLICLMVSAFVTSADAKPNIVFIYTDDQAPFAVNAAGDNRFITPNIDRIFKEGAHLKNSFVTTPVCSPSRVGLISSRYGTEMRITDWINDRKDPQLGLDPATPTWPKFLADAGYRTGLFGKWHLGVQDEYHPVGSKNSADVQPVLVIGFTGCLADQFQLAIVAVDFAQPARSESPRWETVPVTAASR